MGGLGRATFPIVASWSPYVAMVLTQVLRALRERASGASPVQLLAGVKLMYIDVRTAKIASNYDFPALDMAYFLGFYRSFQGENQWN